MIIKYIILTKLLAKNNHKTRQNTRNTLNSEKMVCISYIISILEKDRGEVFITFLVSHPLDICWWVALGNNIQAESSKAISSSNLKYGCQ